MKRSSNLRKLPGTTLQNLVEWFSCVQLDLNGSGLCQSEYNKNRQ